MGFQAFNSLSKAFYSFTSRVWFLTVFIYNYINYLNSFLIDDRAKARARAKVDLEFKSKKLEIAKSGALRVLLSHIIVLVRVKILLGLLKAIKLRKRFFY